MISIPASEEPNFLEQNNIVSDMRLAYNYSDKARQMFDNWGKTINVNFLKDQFGAKPGTGNLFIFQMTVKS